MSQLHRKPRLELFQIFVHLLFYFFLWTKKTLWNGFYVRAPQEATFVDNNIFHKWKIFLCQSSIGSHSSSSFPPSLHRMRFKLEIEPKFMHCLCFWSNLIRSKKLFQTPENWSQEKKGCIPAYSPWDSSSSASSSLSLRGSWSLKENFPERSRLQKAFLQKIYFPAPRERRSHENKLLLDSHGSFFRSTKSCNTHNCKIKQRKSQPKWTFLLPPLTSITNKPKHIFPAIRVWKDRQTGKECTG